jgi:hypothetical protein
MTPVWEIRNRKRGIRMPRGGARPGSGAKLGQKFPKVVLPPTSKREVTDVLMARVKDINVSPLEVMLVGMKLHYDEAKTALALADSLKDGDTKDLQKRVAKIELAESMSYAEKVAPYIHAKLQTTTIKGDKDNPLEVALGLSSLDELRKAVRGS